MNLIEAALRAGEIAENVYFRGLKTETKPDGTPVTNADIAVSEYLMDTCAKHWPAGMYLGEENQCGPKDAELIFPVDEIDGTSDFKKGGRDCSIVIARAVRHTGGVTFEEAVINHFREGICFVATKAGVRLHRKNTDLEQFVEVSRFPRLSEKRIAIATWPVARHNLYSAGWALRNQGFEVLNPGGIAAMAGRLIIGETDCVLFPGESLLNGEVVKSPWHETGPMQFMLEKAGAVCTDLAGRELHFDEMPRENGYLDFRLRCGFAASRNDDIHAEVIATLWPYIDR